MRIAAEHPAWANDVEVNWMLALGSMYLTARRLVFENGLFDRVRDEAAALNLLTDCTEDHPAPGPSAEEVVAVREARRRELGPVAPPASWLRQRGGAPDELSGSGADWSERWRRKAPPLLADQASARLRVPFFMPSTG